MSFPFSVPVELTQDPIKTNQGKGKTNNKHKFPRTLSVLFVSFAYSLALIYFKSFFMNRIMGSIIAFLCKTLVVLDIGRNLIFFQLRFCFSKKNSRNLRHIKFRPMSSTTSPTSVFSKQTIVYFFPKKTIGI